MKLKYDFEIVEMGEQSVAVPVGENNFNGVINLNDVGAKMLSIVAESTTPMEAHEKLCREYPEADSNEIGHKLADFLNQLVREGLLIP